MSRPCLSFREPFGSLLLDGRKTIELRPSDQLARYEGQWLGLRIGGFAWERPADIRRDFKARPDALACGRDPHGWKCKVAGTFLIGKTLPVRQAARLLQGGWSELCARAGFEERAVREGCFATFVVEARWLPKPLASEAGSDWRCVVQISAPPEAWGLLEAPAHQKRQAAAAEEHGAVTSSQLEGAALAAAAEVATAAVRLPEASTAAAAEAASVAAAIAAADEAEAVHQAEAFKVAEAAEAADVAMAVAASLAEPAQAATDEEEEAAMAMAVAASLAPVAPPAVPLSKAEGKRVAGAASAPGAG